MKAKGQLENGQGAYIHIEAPGNLRFYLRPTKYRYEIFQNEGKRLSVKEGRST